MKSILKVLVNVWVNVLKLISSRYIVGRFSINSVISSGKIRKHVINCVVYLPSTTHLYQSDTHGLIHSKQLKISSLSSYQLRINKLTAALKKSKQISVKGTVHMRTDLNIVRKEKAKSSERNQMAKLFELVDCRSEHAQRAEPSTVKCLSLLFFSLLSMKNFFSSS